MKNVIVYKRRLTDRKRIFNILVLILTVVTTSCEKNNDLPPGTILVSVDGNKKSFNNNAKAEWLSVEGGFGLLIYGYKGDTISSNNISFQIASPFTITAKTYKDKTSGNAVQIKYNVSLLFFWDEFTSSTATITITEINSTHVEGTFSGNLTDSGGGSMNLSGGAFNVSF
ncbi:MAG: hypothetical protein QG611_783 [Bacteroidota bacterium]|nr:hypothetical protein [Bacteroidota bacterium]